MGPGSAIARFLVIRIKARMGTRDVIHISLLGRSAPQGTPPVIREVIASYRVSTAN